jgi:hypothetical protein
VDYSLVVISEEDVLDEASIAGFDGDSQTLLAATTLHDQLLQVRHMLCGCALLPFYMWMRCVGVGGCACSA